MKCYKGNLITDILAARASILIGEITASFGQNPIVLPPTVRKKGETAQELLRQASLPKQIHQIISS